jgi:TrkA domain protein
MNRDEVVRSDAVEELLLEAGERLEVVVREDGARELLVERAGGAEAARLRLTEEEARRLAAVLGGGPPVTAASVLDQLSMEWVNATPRTPLPGHSIGELAIRNRTGASILAMVRDDEVLPNPGPDERILVGDVLVVVGTPEQVARFLALSAATE